MIDLTRRKARLDLWIKSQSSQLSSLQQKRLLLGLSVFFLLVFSQIIKGLYLDLFALFIVLPTFAYFFKKSRQKYSFIEKLRKLSYFYQHQQAIRNGSRFEAHSPEEFANPDLVRDLDLHELYSTLNFCFSQEGAKKLNLWLSQKFSDLSLNDRKKWIYEISQCPGLLRKIHINKPEKLIRFNILKKEINRSFLEHNPLWKWLIPISWVLFVGSLFAPTPGIVWKGLLFVYLASSLFYLGLSKDLFSRLQDLLTELTKLSPHMKPISQLAQTLSFTPHLKKREPEANIKQLSFLVSLVSIKTNPIVFYILNTIIPWNFILTEKCEKTRKRMSENLNNWSDELILLEALSCFSNLAIYHKTSWPKLSPDNTLAFRNISHPLIDQKSVVTNDFTQKNGRNIFIITGSNMSGKSTFLRAVGINFTLAKIGAPVFAQDFQFPDYDIVSCIRVSDSLRDGQSYFYAEVRRMRTILETAKNRPVLFLIDEPLRGTNNRERLAGNQSYLNQMLKTQSIGFASTHDLELTQLSQISDAVENYHFSEDWKQTDLYFNYLIQDGPSQSTNALKILAKEGLYESSSL